MVGYYVPMRIGILTDIHGDWDSMERVLARLDGLRCDRLLCLGDLVVHGDHPNRVVDWFRQRPDLPVIKGNHDIGASIDDDALDGLRFFSEKSRAHTEAARAALTGENQAYLRTLPDQLVESDVIYTHATIGNPFALLRVQETLRDTFLLMAGQGLTVMVAGHSHRTRLFHWPRDKGFWCAHHPAEQGQWVYDLDPRDRYVINVGCTAQLKYDPHPPICAVFEPETRRIEFHELPDLRPGPLGYGGWKPVT